MDDPLERRIAEDDQGVGVFEHVANATSEVGKEPAGVDHHIGVEGAQRFRDGGPGLLVGHGPATSVRPNRTGRPPGSCSTWSQTASGVSVRRAAANSEARPVVMVEP